jgi:hypothetical protein
VSKRTRRAVPASRTPSESQADDTAAVREQTDQDQPAGSRRNGRRLRSRPLTYEPERSFLERYRNALLGAGALAVVVVVGGFLLFLSSRPAYACETIWTPNAQEQPPEGRVGATQSDMGRGHLDNGEFQRYPFCPPASGPHFNQPAAPVDAKYYGPNDKIIPQQYIHNLEHGALVVLYSCPEGDCSDVDQDGLKALVDAFPNSPVCDIPAGGEWPVVSRFDDMPARYAAVLWGRVLYQDALDSDGILAFWESEGERTNPEPQCAPPSPSPSPEP